MTQIAQSRSTGIRPNHPALAVAGRVILYVGMGQPDARTEELTGRKAVRVALD